jgi:hypothetical protein
MGIDSSPRRSPPRPHEVAAGGAEVIHLYQFDVVYTTPISSATCRRFTADKVAAEKPEGTGIGCDRVKCDSNSARICSADENN